MPKILVIEDEPDQRRLIQLRLEARGYAVISAARAREGIRLAAREKPALILMDMILPDVHGLDAAIMLKSSEETRDTPVVGISAVGSPEFIKACLQEGLAAYLRKPYDPRELFRTIERLAGPPPSREGPKPRPGLNVAHQLDELENEFKTGAKKRGAAGPEPAAARPSGLILIVDDDAALVNAATLQLSGRGYEVSPAGDGVLGLRRAFERRPDLILLNLILPAGSGEDLVANLRKAPATEGVPVFIMSGLLPARKLEDKARELGVQGFISKPVEPEDLLYIIESVVGG